MAFSIKAQKISRLDKVSSNDTIAPGRAIICGSFIQRLGFKSGGFAQEIYIADTATKQIYAFRVKPIFKSEKDNLFAYHIKPGTYAILKYQYLQSTWYGSKDFHEPIVKSNGPYYIFTVPENSLVNLGIWHFEKQPGSFEDSSQELTDKLALEFKNLNMSNAVVVLPR